MSIQENKEKNALEKLVIFAVMFAMLYGIYAVFKWLFTSPPKEILNGILGFIFLLALAVVFYLLSCLVTGMPIELGKFFGLG